MAKQPSQSPLELFLGMRNRLAEGLQKAMAEEFTVVEAALREHAKGKTPDHQGEGSEEPAPPIPPRRHPPGGRQPA